MVSEGLGERLERERPAFEPVGPSLGLPAAGRPDQDGRGGGAALFETPAWRAHAAQAVTFSAVQSFGQMHRRPGFEAFREAVERAVQRLRRISRRCGPSPRRSPRPSPSLWRRPRLRGAEGAVTRRPAPAIPASPGRGGSQWGASVRGLAALDQGEGACALLGLGAGRACAVGGDVGVHEVAHAPAVALAADALMPSSSVMIRER